MTVKGSVFLRGGFISSEEVRLTSSQIGGTLECTGSSFSSSVGDALNADGVEVRSDVFLDHGFSSKGGVRLLSAKIGGGLICINGTFSNRGEPALNADHMVVTGGVFLQNATINGAVSLSAAKVGSLIDGMGCWKTGGHAFDGLQYDRIIGHTDPALRIDWLNKQRADHLGDEFKPQPWEQLIKVLREMGHSYEAAEIAMAKQRALRAAGKINGTIRKPLHWLYGALAGYGHRPIWTIQWMAVVWLLSAFFFQVGADYGYISPDTPLLNSPALSAEIDAQCGHRFETRADPTKQIWTRCAAMPAEYTTFQPLLYSLDLILPLVDLQQGRDWAPIVEAAPGHNLVEKD